MQDTHISNQQQTPYQNIILETLRTIEHETGVQLCLHKLCYLLVGFKGQLQYHIDIGIVLARNTCITLNTDNSTDIYYYVNKFEARSLFSTSHLKKRLTLPITKCCHGRRHHVPTN